MKTYDWKGYQIPVLVECFRLNSRHSVGVEFKIRASYQDEAQAKADQIVLKHHKNFYDKCGGQYQTKFSRIPSKNHH